MPSWPASADFRFAAEADISFRNASIDDSEMTLWVMRVETGLGGSVAHVRCAPKATMSHQKASRR
jgi:hypothetical protein